MSAAVTQADASAASPREWQPQIVVFACNWCSYAGADTAGDGVGAELGSLEVLALFRDRRPPVIHLAAPPAASRELVARVVDEGVGLEWRNISMTLDGRSVIAEWDPEAERFVNDEEANRWLDYPHRDPWMV